MCPIYFTLINILVRLNTAQDFIHKDITFYLTKNGRGINKWPYLQLHFPGLTLAWGSFRKLGLINASSSAFKPSFYSWSFIKQCFWNSYTIQSRHFGFNDIKRKFADFLISWNKQQKWGLSNHNNLNNNYDAYIKCSIAT